MIDCHIQYRRSDVPITILLVALLLVALLLLLGQHESAFVLLSDVFRHHAVAEALGEESYHAVNMNAADGATALYLASQNGHVEVVRLLLARKGVEVNKTAADGGTALMVASQKGRVEVVRSVITVSGAPLTFLLPPATIE